MISRKYIIKQNIVNYKIGGPAKFFLEADNIDNLLQDLKEWQKNHDGKILIIGAGTNILFSDLGFNGLVILPNFKFIKKLDEQHDRGWLKYDRS